MAKRSNGAAWWVAAALAALLLVGAGLLFAWSIKKPWLPGYLDLQLRGVWLVYALMSLFASLSTFACLWEARRGRFRWRAEGLVSAAIVAIVCAILLPITVVDDGLHPAAYAKLEGRNLQGARLGSYGFAFANLRHANLTRAWLGYSSFWGADLTDANLTGAKLNHARLWYVRAAGVNLTRANLENALLHAADLRGARLHDADLKNARLDDLGKQVSAHQRAGADLRDADLTGADLRGAALQGAILSGALYDASTRWPAGFNPVKHGAILTSRSHPPRVGSPLV